MSQLQTLILTRLCFCLHWYSLMNTVKYFLFLPNIHIVLFRLFRHITIRKYEIQSLMTWKLKINFIIKSMNLLRLRMILFRGDGFEWWRKFCQRWIKCSTMRVLLQEFLKNNFFQKPDPEAILLHRKKERKKSQKIFWLPPRFPYKSPRFRKATRQTEKVINTQHKKKTPSHTRDGFKLNIECVRKHTLTIKITNIHASEWMLSFVLKSLIIAQDERWRCA